MDQHDLNNLLFLQNASPHQWLSWCECATKDDIHYAKDLLEMAELEALDDEVMKMTPFDLVDRFILSLKGKS